MRKRATWLIAVYSSRSLVEETRNCHQICWNEDSSQAKPESTFNLTINSKVLVGIFFKGSSSGKQWFFFVWFRPIVRMHAAGQWLSWRQNDSVGRLLGVWSLLRHVDSWKRWSQKGWPRRMGQDWCARRRKRSSSGCCPCGPRVHPSSRLVRARVKLFLHRTCLIRFVKVSDRGTNVWLLIFFFNAESRINLLDKLNLYLS